MQIVEKGINLGKCIPDCVVNKFESDVRIRKENCTMSVATYNNGTNTNPSDTLRRNLMLKKKQFKIKVVEKSRKLALKVTSETKQVVRRDGQYNNSENNCTRLISQVSQGNNQVSNSSVVSQIVSQTSNGGSILRNALLTHSFDYQSVPTNQVMLNSSCERGLTLPYSQSAATVPLATFVLSNGQATVCSNFQTVSPMLTLEQNSSVNAQTQTVFINSLPQAVTQSQVEKSPFVLQVVNGINQENRGVLIQDQVGGQQILKHGGIDQTGSAYSILGENNAGTVMWTQSENFQMVKTLMNPIVRNATLTNNINNNSYGPPVIINPASDIPTESTILGNCLLNNQLSYGTLPFNGNLGQSGLSVVNNVSNSQPMNTQLAFNNQQTSVLPQSFQTLCQPDGLLQNSQVNVSSPRLVIVGNAPSRQGNHQVVAHQQQSTNLTSIAVAQNANYNEPVQGVFQVILTQPCQPAGGLPQNQKNYKVVATQPHRNDGASMQSEKGNVLQKTFSIPAQLQKVSNANPARVFNCQSKQRNRDILPKPEGNGRSAVTPETAKYSRGSNGNKDDGSRNETLELTNNSSQLKETSVLYRHLVNSKLEKCTKPVRNSKCLLKTSEIRSQKANIKSSNLYQMLVSSVPKEKVVKHYSRNCPSKVDKTVNNKTGDVDWSAISKSNIISGMRPKRKAREKSVSNVIIELSDSSDDEEIKTEKVTMDLEEKTNVDLEWDSMVIIENDIHCF